MQLPAFKIVVPGIMLLYLTVAALPAHCQNLIPDSSFSSTTPTSNGPYWENKLTKTGFFVSWNDSVPYPYPAVLDLPRLSEDSSHSNFYVFRPLNFHSPEDTHFFSDVLSCKLSQPMVRDSVYEISLWILPPPGLALSSIQVYFSEKSVPKVALLKNQSRVDLYREDSSAIANPVISCRKKAADELGTFHTKFILRFENKWIRVTGKYKAAGNETFFYIGNINSFTYTAYSSSVKNGKLRPQKQNNPHRSPGATFDFYIDDVSIRRITTLRK